MRRQHETVIAFDLPHAPNTTSEEFRHVEKSIYQVLDEELEMTFALEGRRPAIPAVA